MISGGSAVQKRSHSRTKPYVMKRDKKTGALYLERERPPFVGELPYVTVLVIAILFALCSCCKYIQLCTDVETRIRQAELLEREVLALREANTMMECHVSQTPDLNMVYQIAVEELGMIPVTGEHLLVFERSNSEYVYQTDNIPKIGF